ncbi:MAG: Carboxysome shell and ethanolamine utilization microcompartment protein CcmK/EutM [Verrucomicrobia bacterium]|jgi:microcompartment protein CcmK/EutM|nr:MAG: Carboxysome shell and ethanolamine utilization microcompartment protein CcmK/EutM [Verrucomicrobiota bacterium]
MRLGHVIGKVTLSRQDPSYRGGRFLLVRPWAPSFAQATEGRSQNQTAGPTLVVYDNLGAGLGHLIGFTEGSEASKPFAEATPVDAYNAAIADEIFHQPPQ